MSEQLRFFKGNEENLPEIIEESSIYHCEDTGNTYLGRLIMNYKDFQALSVKQY